MKRLSKEEAVNLIKNADFLELGERAFQRKLELHPDRITSFVIDRNINYTNICWVDCTFCAFCRKANEKDAYILSYEELDKKIEELLEIGGTQILFQGGVHPSLKIDFYEALVEHVHKKYPQITIHGFSAVEIDYIAKISKLSIKEVFERLKAKGLYSMPGAGAEVLSDRVKNLIAPKKLDAKRWIEIHKIAHQVGLKTTATMMFGTLESDEEIVDHLELLRQLQDETGGFRAFILWSFQSANTKLKELHPEIIKQAPNRYLRLLAVSRLYLDNFKNIQSSWVTQGSYIGQLALKFGANDLGSTMMEENVVKAAGANFRMSKDEMIELIYDIGEIPAIRNTNYDFLKVYDEKK